MSDDTSNIKFTNSPEEEATLPDEGARITVQADPNAGFELKIKMDVLRKRKLMVATPMYGGLCHGMYCRSMIDLSAICAKNGIALHVYYLFNESLITRARNYCADEFVRSEATHLMFIDSDIGFNAQDVIALMAMADESTDFDIVGAPYPKKCIAWEKIKQAVDKGFAEKNPNDLENFVGDYVFNPAPGMNEIRLNRPAEVLEMGTGFMMIQKRTFTRMAEHFPEFLYRPDHVRQAHFDGSRLINAFFQDPIDRTDFAKLYRQKLEEIAMAETLEDVQRIVKEAQDIKEEGSNRLLSEDYFFCQKAREAGMKVWICPWMQLKHTGSYTFGGTLMHLAAIGAAGTADGEQLAKIKKQDPTLSRIGTERKPKPKRKF